MSLSYSKVLVSAGIAEVRGKVRSRAEAVRGVGRGPVRSWGAAPSGGGARRFAREPRLAVEQSQVTASSGAGAEGQVGAEPGQRARSASNKAKATGRNRRRARSWSLLPPAPGQGTARCYLGYTFTGFREFDTATVPLQHRLVLADLFHRAASSAPVA